jgi:hypothetical protein
MALRGWFHHDALAILHIATLAPWARLTAAESAATGMECCVVLPESMGGLEELPKATVHSVTACVLGETAIRHFP